MKTYNKLVRDNIPAIIEANGRKANYRTLDNDEEYKQALKIKLIEESLELLSAKNEADELEELVDIELIINEIVEINKIDLIEYAHAFSIKNEKNGGFTKRYFLESADE